MTVGPVGVWFRSAEAVISYVAGYIVLKGALGGMNGSGRLYHRSQRIFLKFFPGSSFVALLLSCYVLALCEFSVGVGGATTFGLPTVEATVLRRSIAAVDIAGVGLMAVRHYAGVDDGAGL